MTTELVRQEPQALAYRHELTVEELAAQVDKIHQVMSKLMKPEIHYGTIPGTKKPTLYKPGAELLCMLFRLDPQPSVEEIREGEHLAIRSTTVLYHIPTGLRWGSGMGSCSTHESKYAFRKSGRACPSCGKEDTIIRGKAEFGGGWLCFAKKGGCGARFEDGDATIETQQTEARVANPDLADTHNTVLKMANKRSLVAAVLNVTAASEIFTQDVAKDDENDETPPREDHPESRREPDAETKTISEAQLKRLHAIATAGKWSEAQAKALLAEFGYASSRDVTLGHYESICERLKSKPPAAA